MHILPPVVFSFLCKFPVLLIVYAVPINTMVLCFKLFLLNVTWQGPNLCLLFHSVTLNQQQSSFEVIQQRLIHYLQILTATYLLHATLTPFMYICTHQAYIKYLGQVIKSFSIKIHPLHNKNDKYNTNHNNVHNIRTINIRKWWLLQAMKLGI